MVYCGVGGDKVGMQWSFEDVQIVCQRTKLQQKTSINAFGSAHYEFANIYETQFPEPMPA